MSRLERWIVYPVLALLCWASFGRGAGIGVRTALADEPAPKMLETQRFGVVEAKEFRLVDGTGAERGTLRAPTQERPGWGLYLWDKSGSPRAFLALDRDDAPTLGLGAIGLQTKARGENTLEIVDAKGTTRFLVGVTSSESGLSLFDPGGKMRARILVDTASSSITLLDKEEKELWQAPSK
jgi:hypothetical protein